MAGTIQEAKLSSPTSRSRLKPGRQPHWHTITAGRDHLGWQRWPHDKAGRWLLRRRRGGSYSTEQIGIADDDRSADGISILSFDQARAKAVELAAGETRPSGRVTVLQVMANYIDHLQSQGKSSKNAESAAGVHILPRLGELEVASLTSSQLQRWLADVAGRGNLSITDKLDDEGVRKRRSSANRVFNILTAALNHAFDQRRVSSNDAWGRRVKKFRGVDAARARYLSVDEAQRLLNACDPSFRLLVRGALETGCRYSELGRLEVGDFNSDAGTVHVRKSKSGKGRHVVLTDDGARFFARVSAGQPKSHLMFTRPNGRAWGPSNQGAHMAQANEHAKIDPPITFHGLRHTWASLAVMNGVPLMVVAKNLGHADTQMAEKHYSHLAPSYVSEAIRAGAPKFGGEPADNVQLLVRKH
jgi:integrase